MSPHQVVDEEAVASPDSAHISSTRGIDEEAETRTESDTSETSTTVAAPDWDGPEDVGNPKNWPTWKRVYHTSIPALYGFVVTIATSSYVPAIPLVMADLHVSREVAVLPLSLYTLGIGVGPIIAAPLSELYGRRLIYWTTLPLLILFLGIAGESDNIAQLVVARFIAAVCGSGALAVGAGTIADLWSPRGNGRAAVFFILSPFLGPALGPLIGAYIISEYNNDWRWSQWVVIIVASPILILALFIKETSKNQILTRRHKGTREKTGHQSGDKRILLRKLRTSIIRPLNMLFREPAVGFLSLYTGFAFAMMFSFFGSYSYVFQKVYHFNQKEVGLTFIGILIGFFCSVATFGIFDATLYRKAAALAARKGQRPAPEYRLYTAMLGSIMLPIGLFWFAWAPRTSVHWIVPVLAGVPFGWGCLAIFVSVTIYLVDVYQSAGSASALAANGILRYLFGGVFPLFTLQMYKAMGIHNAGTVFACVGVALMPLPWWFFKYGERVRMKSIYAPHVPAAA